MQRAVQQRVALTNAGHDHTSAAVERVLQERSKPALLVFGVIEVNCGVTGLEETGAHWGEFWDRGLHTARDTLLWNCGNTDCTGEGAEYYRRQHGHGEQRTGQFSTPGKH